LSLRSEAWHGRRTLVSGLVVATVSVEQVALGVTETQVSQLVTGTVNVGRLRVEEGEEGEAEVEHEEGLR
jgi:hypothetical protein